MIVSIEELATILREEYVAEVDTHKKGLMAMYLLSFSDGNRSERLRQMMQNHIAYRRKRRH